ncbi:hypothetical protein SFRURICE_013724 [Spodoptera frugiperda]|nr:hypothetical protein SFRURICE_013724 [Spodoptera frugiperda]
MHRLQNESFWDFKGKVDFVDEWFLMKSPVPVITITATYLYFVLKVGPEYMKSRKPYNLNNIIILYNIFQVFASVYLFYLCTQLMLANGFVGKTCLLEKEQTRRDITNAMYYYFLAKISELLDTVFFVLRKKDSQVTFLHVYHHAMMVVISWSILKYEPIYLTIYIRNVNSFVHMIMYTYYCLSAVPALKNYLWWKKYITKLQLVKSYMNKEKRRAEKENQNVQNFDKIKNYDEIKNNCNANRVRRVSLVWNIWTKMEINNGTSDIGYNGTEIRPEPIYGNTDFVDTWFLMGSPIAVAIILTSYLLFVLKIGPAFMMKRAPYQLSNVLLLYNAVQVGVSCFLFHKCFTMLVENGVVPKTCLMETDYSRRSITTAMYCYLLAKVSELLDTIFFILRKKNNQVTFLHVYHHAVMVFVTWTALKYEPTFALVFMGMLNSFVHIVMYTYYGLSAYPNLVKYLWWKKYITKLQLLQFVLVLLQFATAFATSSCPPSKIMFASMIFNGLLFIYLFGSFYINTYNRRNKKVNIAKETDGSKNMKEDFNGIQKEDGKNEMKISKDEKVTDGNDYTSAAIKLNDKYCFTFNLQTKKLL